MANLSDEDGSHRLVESGTVHVDGGADRHDETRDARINTVALLEAGDGDRQCSRTRACAECRGHGLGHVRYVDVGILAREEEVDKRQDEEAVDGQADHHREEVHAQLGHHLRQCLHLDDLRGDQEEHTKW